jgi:transcriptional regulator with XRE-family HTH domain
MTSKNDEERSMYDARAATLVGVLGLAAAAAAWQLVRLFLAAKAASRLSSKAVAERMGVTDGRVSQILSGDGNVHIATAARVLRAMGYELQLAAVPVEPGRPSLAIGRRQSRKRAGARQERVYDVYTQTFLTHEGPMKVPMLVPSHDSLRAAPFGRPVKLGEVTVSEHGTVRPIQANRRDWQTKATEKPRVAAV